MKATSLTSTDVLISMYGVRDVHTFQYVKAGSMYLSRELTRALVRLVDGREGGHGESFDAITPQGQWEFTLSHNAKNKAGDAHDRDRSPGHCVQILGRPKPGWISAEDFLELHGLPGFLLLDVIDEVVANFRAQRQERLPV